MTTQTKYLIAVALTGITAYVVIEKIKAKNDKAKVDALKQQALAANSPTVPSTATQGIREGEPVGSQPGLLNYVDGAVNDDLVSKVFS